MAEEGTSSHDWQLVECWPNCSSSAASFSSLPVAILKDYSFTYKEKMIAVQIFSCSMFVIYSLMHNQVNTRAVELVRLWPDHFLAK